MRYVVLAGVAVFGVTGAAVQLSRVDGGFAGETAVRLLLVGLASGSLAALGWHAVIWHAERLGGRGATL